MFLYSGIAILAGVIMFMSWSSLALSIGSIAFMLIVIGAAMGALEHPGIVVYSHRVSEDVADYQFDSIESKRSVPKTVAIMNLMMKFCVWVMITSKNLTN